MTGVAMESIFIANNELKVFNENNWVANSGATTHMTNSLERMFDMKDVDGTISVGDGRKLTTAKIEKWRGKASDSEGKETNIVLTNVSYLPKLMVNLFSVTGVMEKGAMVERMAL